jgi:hypothetical protein
MAKSMSLGTVGLGCSLILCAVAATSCGGAQGSDDGGDEGGSSGSGATTGGSTTGGSSTGGSATGGTAGSATGGTGGILCAPSGTEPVPPGGDTLATDDCMPNPTPQTCSGSTPNGHMPPDGVLIKWDTYKVASGDWGNSTVGDLTGGTSKYNGREVMPINAAAECGELHLTATLPPYTPAVTDDAENYAGLVFWFGPCIDASDFGGLSFTVRGDMGGAALKLQVQTSENYPADPANSKGACVFANCDTRWTECKGPDTTITVSAAGESVSLDWSAFVGGSPNAEVDATGLVGLQFQLECQSQDEPCNVDITLGTISLFL